MRVIVLIVGIAALLKGALAFFFPSHFRLVLAQMTDEWLRIIGFMAFLLGVAFVRLAVGG